MTSTLTSAAKKGVEELRGASPGTVPEQARALVAQESLDDADVNLRDIAELSSDVIEEGRVFRSSQFLR